MNARLKHRNFGKRRNIPAAFERTKQSAARGLIRVRSNANNSRLMQVPS